MAAAAGPGGGGGRGGVWAGGAAGRRGRRLGGALWAGEVAGWLHTEAFFTNLLGAGGGSEGGTFSAARPGLDPSVALRPVALCVLVALCALGGVLVQFATMWVGAEAIFYVMLRARRRDFQGVLPVPPPRRGVWQLQKMVEACDILEPVWPDVAESFLRGWFHGRDPLTLGEADWRAFVAEHWLLKDIRPSRIARIGSLTRPDSKDARLGGAGKVLLPAWGGMPLREEVLSAAEQERLEELLEVLQVFLAGVRARRGRGPSDEPLPAPREGYTGASPQRPGFNLVGGFPTLHLPLVFYVFLNFVNLGSAGFLYLFGFRPYRQHSSALQGLTYWHRPAEPREARARAGRGRGGGSGGRGGDDGKLAPCIFIPGIGLGMTTYYTLIRSVLLERRGGDLFLVEMPHVNMKSPWHEGWGQAMAQDKFQACVRNMLVERGHTEGARPVIVAHSYGNFMCRWLMRENPFVSVQGAVMLDPLTFLTVWPEISQNIAQPMELPQDLLANRALIRKVILREPGIARCFNRHAVWSEAIMWDEDFGDLAPDARLAALFGRDDAYYDARKSYEYLHRAPAVPQARVWLHLGPGGHGGFLLDPDSLGLVARMVAYASGEGARDRRRATSNAFRPKSKKL